MIYLFNYLLKRREKQTAGIDTPLVLGFMFLCSMDVETGEYEVQAYGSCSVPNRETAVRQSIAIPPLSSDAVLVPNELALSATRRV